MELRDWRDMRWENGQGVDWEELGDRAYDSGALASASTLYRHALAYRHAKRGAMDEVNRLKEKIRLCEEKKGTT